MLVATMLNYMDRQALAQQATEISRDLNLTNEDYGRVEAGFGLAFAVGGIVTGLIADRVSPRWLYPVVLFGLVRRWVRDRLGDHLSRAARMSDLAGLLRVGPVAVRACDRAALLSRRDRPLGNSILQSGASLGAIATPFVVILSDNDRPG